MLQRPVSVFDSLAPKGLRQHGVEAKQDAADPERQRVIRHLTQRGCSQRDGGVGQVADHHGVDDAHGHPADLRRYQR